MPDLSYRVVCLFRRARRLTTENASENSTGKSYLPLEIAALFLRRTESSLLRFPASFFHDHVTKEVEEQEEEEKWPDSEEEA